MVLLEEVMRLKDWNSRFAGLVSAVQARPFAWGEHDCCLWAADAVQALTGADPAGDLRGTYQTEQGAARVLLRIGGLVAAGARCGCEIDLRRVIAGDVGLVRWPDGVECLGVRGAKAWICVGESGLVWLPDNSASRAWGVGRE
jgi:hypothetical protein